MFFIPCVHDTYLNLLDLGVGILVVTFRARHFDIGVNRGTFNDRYKQRLHTVY